MNQGSQSAGARRVKTSEQVARNLLNEIRVRDLKPGDMLPDEATMLGQYNVSRGSLREALRLLEQHGLIQLKPGPGGGPMVSKPEPRHIGHMLSLFLSVAGTTYGDLLELLLIIYPLTARRAAERASEAEIADLLAHSDDDAEEAILTDADNAESRLRPMGVSRFHIALEELAGNPVYSLMIDAIRSIIVEHVVASTDKRIFNCCHADHTAIAKRIAAGDGEGAASLMYSHVLAVIDRHREQIPGLFDAPVRW